MVSPYLNSYEENWRIGSDNAPGGVLVYYADGDEEIIHVNRYVVELFECESTEDFLNYVHGSFRAFVYEEDINSAEDSVWGQVNKQDGFDHIYYRIKTKTGKIVSVDDYGRLVDRHDGGRPIFFVFLTEMRREDAIDWLTGLSGMQRFHTLARLAAKVSADRGETPVAVAFDLMGMKGFNAKYGRDEGDRLLRTFAEVLRSHFGNEACSRFAEDHFFALCTTNDAEEKVEALFQDFARSNGGRVLPVRAGLYALEPGDDIVSVGIDRARAACDLDRKTWRSHYAWFTEQMRADEQIRIHVIEGLNRALSQGWIKAYYQPIVRSATSDVCGEEAFARWDDPKFGMLMPEQFIPILEEAGLAYRIDLHMLDVVIQDLVKRRELGVKLVPVSVNISPTDLTQIDLSHEFSVRADSHGLSHDLLRAEITELATVSNPQVFKRQVSELRTAGFEVWMDDFGSGYSSLSMMQELDFDVIKLDMGFASGQRAGHANAIVSNIIKASNQLGVVTLAEGIESFEQARALEEVGCDMFQGFFFANPCPLDEEIERISSSADFRCEERSEAEYWRQVGLVGLNDVSALSSLWEVDVASTREFPLGVLERRGDEWRILRGNGAYLAYLEETAIVLPGRKPMTAYSLGKTIDSELEFAAEQSMASGAWERVAGGQERTIAYQFYVRHIASSSNNNAFQVAGVPTMLGSALGLYGDVPVAYAVFRAIFDETGNEVVDTEYVYANSYYCEMTGLSQGKLIGSSFLSAVPNASTTWFPYCYRATKLGESVHDVVYSSEVKHWLSFTIAPSPVEDHCVYAFNIVDEERLEVQKMAVGLDTSDLIITIADALSDEKSYSAAVTSLLETLGSIVHPKRMHLYEIGEQSGSATFEWCAEGVEPRIDRLQDIPIANFMRWERLFERIPLVVMPDLLGLKAYDEQLYENARAIGTERFVAVPLYNDGKLIGLLGADDYNYNGDYEMKRLLKTVASFLSARIASHRLMEELEASGLHDALTGLLNRRGIDLAVSERLRANPKNPYVLILVDVDDFKRVNDLYGHDVGDVALTTLAKVVTDTFPEKAVVGRNGGDEFLVMLAGDDVKQVDSLVNELVSRELSCVHKGVRYPLSLSMGYAGYPAQARDLKEAYSMADTALYAVKLAGKSGAKCFVPEMEEQYRSQLGFTPREILENIPGSVLVHRPGHEGEILFASEELVKLAECSSVQDFMDFTGGRSSAIVHPDDWDRASEEMRASLAESADHTRGQTLFRFVTKGGNACNVIASCRLVNVKDLGNVFYELLMPVE